MDSSCVFLERGTFTRRFIRGFALWEDRLMGKRTSYVHGTFSWVDNATTDQDAAKRFYGALFGWDFDDRPVGDGAVYSVALKGSDPVAAIAPQQDDEIDQGIPPHWNNYVTVDELEPVASRVNELGGQLIVPPFDVMDVGRMAVLADPAGAILCLWQPLSMPGASVVNEPGALCWNEVGTHDPEAAQGFYGELFGWTFDLIPGIELEYWTIKNGDRANGGMRAVELSMPSFWLAYFGVDSIPAGLETTEANGGKVVVPQTPTGPENSFAVIEDPAGAMLGIFEGTYDD
jgi:uncharacterized protein